MVSKYTLGSSHLMHSVPLLLIFQSMSFALFYLIRLLVAIDGEDVTDLTLKEIVKNMAGKSEKGCNLTVITTVRQECRSVGTV